jgi:hypothetical protein
MGNKNYKLFLYRPAAANYAVDTSQYRAEFLGELRADNVNASIKLQEISTLSFTLPENILGELNTRLDEVLDNYVVELWYGDLTGATLGPDYFPTTGDRIRFIITTSNLQYSDGAKTYAFEANSIEYTLEFKQLLNWPGIEIKDFYRTITYNATNEDFEEIGQTDYSISTSTNSKGTKYITVPTTTATTNPPSTFDIFIYQYRRNDNDTVNSENSVIEYTGGVNDEGFRQGFYVPTLDVDGKVTAISISLPNDITEFDAAGKNFEIFLYDNPLSRHFAIGINTDSELDASDMYLDLAQDAEDGDPLEFNGFTFTSQKIYSINGLKLEHILLGTQESRTSGNIDNSKLTIDGVLYDTGFTIGEIQADIAAKYRSNIELNNITKYEAIKNIAESFDAIAVFNTITKTVSFYPDKNEKVFSNNGLIITKDNYLKSISNDINATKIVTKVYGAGKDNLGLELITPNGNAVWEDYSYFLDTYYVEYDRTSLLTVTYNNTTGVSFSSFPTGALSRWMESTQALALAKWQYARDYFHDIMLGELDPTISEHYRYYDLYNLRSEGLNKFVKEETKYFELKATEFKYKYIYERYVKINKEGGNPETQGYEETYEEKYNDAVAASAAALAELNKLHYNLYNTRFDGSIAVSGDADYSILAAIQTNSYATKIAEVQDFLNKGDWTIDAIKLKAFEKEAVMTDSKLDNELDLLLAVQEFTKENCIPVVTMDVDVVDFLATKDYSVDWNKAVIGEVVNIYYPDFNIDTTAQLREISIDFQANSLKFIISTYRQYSRLPLNYIAKQIRMSYDNSANLFKYTHDDNKVSNERAKSANIKLERAGFAAENAPIRLGAKSPDGTTSTEISGEGFVSKVIGVDPILETFTYETTKTLTIADGNLLAKNIISESLISEVEISGDSGLVIRKIESGVSTPQVSIDVNGNAIFAGTLQATTGQIGGWNIDTDNLSSNAFEIYSGSSPYLSIDQATNGYGNDGIFLGIASSTASSTPKFSMVTDSGATFLKYDPSATYDLEIAGNAKIGPLFIGNTDSSTATIADVETGDTLLITAPTAAVRTRTYTFSPSGKRNVTNFSISYSNGIDSDTALRVFLYYDTTIIETYGYLLPANDTSTINQSLNFIATKAVIELRHFGGGSGSVSVDSVTFTENLATLFVGDLAVYPTGNIFTNKYQTTRISISENEISSFGQNLLISSDGLEINGTEGTLTDGIILRGSSTTGSNSRRITLTTPTSQLTGSRTIRFPDAEGTIALQDDSRFTDDRRAIFYEGVSATATSTTSKTATISGFSRDTGVLVKIRFTNGNTANAATLNISSTGAANIRIGGVNVTTNNFSLGPTQEVIFRWNGAQYDVVSTTRIPNYSLIGVSSAIANSTTYTELSFPTDMREFILNIHQDTTTGAVIARLPLTITGLNTSYSLDTTARTHRVAWSNGSVTQVMNVELYYSTAGTLFFRHNFTGANLAFRWLGY